MVESSPRETKKVQGHHDAQQSFLDAFQENRLHHAWLICGPEGIGKVTLAFQLARLVLNADDHTSPAGRRVSARTHGDLLEISRQMDVLKGRLRNTITVSDVKPIYKFFHHTATESGWRVVIVDGVEFLNRFAANALLKVLEEPPPQTLLLLTTAVPGKLLPTLRSRCRKLLLSSLKKQEMEDLLPNISTDIIERAQGSPGRALFLAHDKDGRIASLTRRALEGQSINKEIWHELKNISRETEGFALMCDFLGEEIAKQAIKSAQSGDLSHAVIYAQKKMALDSLRYKTESFSLDKAQAIRQAFALASSSDNSTFKQSDIG